MEKGINPKDLIGDKKPPIHLIPPVALLYIAEGLADGAKKYGPFNWRKNKVQAHAYYSAGVRHHAAWWDGEELARDSGKHHLAHEIANLAILIDALEGGFLVDDRPTPGPTAAVIEKLTRRE